MIALYLDEDSGRSSLARGLRTYGIDVVSTFEVGRVGAEGEDQLLFAASEGRVLYSSKVGHFHRLHSDCLRAGRHHAGIVLLPDQRTSISAQVRALTRLANERTPETMRDKLEYLSHWL